MARYGIRILAAAIVVGMGCLAWLPARFVQRPQLTTEDRLKQPVFWPRKTAASAEDFEGVAGCASCHASIANSQRATPMALTAMLAKDSADLLAHAALEFSSGRMARMEGIEEVPEKGIYNPAELSPADAMDFCGACHGAMWDVVLPVPKGTKTARFEPYRLQDSKCWGKDGDARLICTACHDPHKALERNAEGYDGACLRCHPSSKKEERVRKLPGKVCPVGKSKCAGCHMANVYIPEVHHSFHDHKIRILREASTRH